MKYEMFGDTGLTVSKLALGCGPFGSHLSEEELRFLMNSLKMEA